MPNPADEGTPKFYREQAQRIRELVGHASTPSIKAQLEGVAVQDERMAEHAERRKKLGR